ncbi:unnamed protein product [Somion occarium]|uniref:Nitronate monooxygenase domain-containing protein n=1 Tax=Somion occarium TaxID=3059160 RepID=A0ABP1E015_9APHY
MSFARPITTRLTRLLNIQTPIVCAAMAVPGINDMAAAVTESGGFGFLGTAFDDVPTLKSTMRTLRERLKTPAGSPVPAGVGFVGWVLDSAPNAEERIVAVLEERPVAVWLAFGDHLERYARIVQEYDAKHGRKTFIFTIINTVAEALRAANEWKVDALIVQGIEAGGHGGAHTPPLFELLPAVIEALPNGPLLVAAGGIATGPQIAALLTLGADGVALGTRFLFTPECAWPPVKKQMLLDADLNSTVRGMAFDEVMTFLGWPKGVNGRAIRNKIVDDVEEGASMEERIKRFKESEQKGEKDRVVVWAGIGAGLTNEIKPTSVVRLLHEDAVQALQVIVSVIA